MAPLRCCFMIGMIMLFAAVGLDFILKHMHSKWRGQDAGDVHRGIDWLWESGQ